MLKRVVAILMVFISSVSFAQKVSEQRIQTPDEVKKMCDKLFISEMGEKMFAECVRYDSSSGGKATFANGETREDHVLSYTFSYPETKGASFELQMYYSVYSGSGHLQSGRFLRMDQTDLPKDIQQKGEKVISYEKAKKIAEGADNLIAKGEGSFVLGDDSFYWHFTYRSIEPNPQGDSETQIVHNVIVDPYSGKVTSQFVSNN